MPEVLSATVPVAQGFVKLEDVREEYDRQIRYAVTENMKSSATIFKRTDKNMLFTGDQQRTNKSIPLAPVCKFIDKNGKNRITRYKPSSNYIDQAPQIKVDEIGANEKTSPVDRDRLKIVDGFLDANDAYTNWFLSADNCPYREDFTGRSRGGHAIMIKVVDEEKQEDETFSLMQSQTSAANKIIKLGKEDVDNILVMFFGTNFPLPKTENKSKTTAIEALGDNKERIKIVNEFGAKDVDIDTAAKILVNKAIQKGIIQFAINENNVLLNRTGEFEKVKVIAADTQDEQQTLFLQFLTTPEGAALRNDIENMVSDSTGDNKKQNNKKK